ncbi:hypothetical protein STENM223S_06776 [Streptomyces tendae]
MNDERYDPLWHNADATDPYYETGTGRHRAGAVYAEPRVRRGISTDMVSWTVSASGTRGCLG